MIGARRLLTMRKSAGDGGLPDAPEGYAYVVDAEGKYLIDATGAYLIAEIS